MKAQLLWYIGQKNKQNSLHDWLRGQLAVSCHPLKIYRTSGAYKKVDEDDNGYAKQRAIPILPALWSHPACRAPHRDWSGLRQTCFYNKYVKRSLLQLGSIYSFMSVLSCRWAQETSTGNTTPQHTTIYLLLSKSRQQIHFGIEFWNDLTNNTLTNNSIVRLSAWCQHVRDDKNSSEWTFLVGYEMRPDLTEALYDTCYLGVNNDSVPVLSFYLVQFSHKVFCVPALYCITAL